MKMIKFTLASAAASLLLASCASVPLEICAPPVAAIKGGDSAVLTHGRDLYLGTCTKCHKPENLHKYDAAELKDDILPTMCRKSKLSKADEDAVIAYCTRACTVPVPDPKAAH